MEDRRSTAPEPFQLNPSFHSVEDTGTFLPQDFATEYEALYAEALSEGSISDGERARLDLAARALGLPDDRILQLEEAIRAAYEARASITRTDAGETHRSDPIALGDDAASKSIVVSAAELGATEDEAAQPEHATMPPEGSVSDRPPDLGAFDDDRPTPRSIPAVLRHRLPEVEEDELHERFAQTGADGDIDAQFCTAAVLVRRGDANAEERFLHARFRATTLQRPTRPLTTTAWTTLLYYPLQERDTSDIFATVAQAALFARTAAMGKDGVLTRLDPAKRQDPATTTVSMVRAIGWCAATLGLRAPPIYIAPESDTGLEIVTAVPPASRIGARMLSGPSALELAFHAGRHLTWFREDTFVCALVAVEHLEDIFLASLLIGAPDLPLLPEVRLRASLTRDALLPVLERGRVARLTELTARFLAHGGRTNLRRWAQAAELTACRAGLLVCGDLATACDVLLREPDGAEKVAEIEGFWASDAASELRRDLGVAVSFA